MTIDEAYALHTVLLETKTNKLEKETLKKLILLKLKLQKVAKDFNEAREHISNETKCEDESKWNEDFMNVFREYTAKEVDIDPHILTMDDMVTLIQGNELLGGQETYLCKYLIKGDKEEVLEPEEVN